MLEGALPVDDAMPSAQFIDIAYFAEPNFVHYPMVEL